MTKPDPSRILGSAGEREIAPPPERSPKKPSMKPGGVTWREPGLDFSAVNRLWWRPILILSAMICLTALTMEGLQGFTDRAVVDARGVYLKAAIDSGHNVERVLCLAAMSDPKVEAYVVREPCTAILMAAEKEPTE